MENIKKEAPYVNIKLARMGSWGEAMEIDGYR
jgi:hypothetical protein